MTWKDYPYVGYGHKLLPGDKFIPAMKERQADSLLRADLMKRLMMFRDYGSVRAGCWDTASIPRADYYGR